MMVEQWDVKTAVMMVALMVEKTVDW